MRRDGYLPAGDVDGCHDVGCVRVKAPDAAGHGRAHQVLVDVQLHQFSRAALQHLQGTQTVLRRLKYLIGMLCGKTQWDFYQQ